MFANLVDFDQAFGHRNDPRGYADALEAFDRRLPEILDALGPDDVLIITADHGNDPTTPSTDHSREKVFVLATGPESRRESIWGSGPRSPISGPRLADLLGVATATPGSLLRQPILTALRARRRHPVPVGGGELHLVLPAIPVIRSAAHKTICRQVVMTTRGRLDGGITPLQRRATQVLGADPASGLEERPPRARRTRSRPGPDLRTGRSSHLAAPGSSPWPTRRAGSARPRRRSIWGPRLPSWGSRCCWWTSTPRGVRHRARDPTRRARGHHLQLPAGPRHHSGRGDHQHADREPRPTALEHRPVRRRAHARPARWPGSSRCCGCSHR